MVLRRDECRDQGRNQIFCFADYPASRIRLNIQSVHWSLFTTTTGPQFLIIRGIRKPGFSDLIGAPPRKAIGTRQALANAVFLGSWH